MACFAAAIVQSLPLNTRCCYWFVFFTAYDPPSSRASAVQKCLRCSEMPPLFRNVSAVQKCLGCLEMPRLFRNASAVQQCLGCSEMPRLFRNASAVQKCLRCFSLFNIDVSPCRWRVRSQVSDAGGFPRFELCLDGWLGRCFPECIVRGRPLSPGSVRVFFFFVFVMSPGPCKDWADGPSPTPLRGEGRMAKVHRFGGVPLWLGVRCFSLFNIDVSPCRWRVRSQVSDAGGFPRFELCLDGWLGRCFPECIVRGRPLSPGSVRVFFFVFVMSPGPCKDWADGPSPTPLRGEGRMAKVHRFGGVPLWLGVRCFSLFNIDVSPCRWRVRSQVSDAGGFPRFELCLDGWLGRCFPECIVRGRPLSPGSVRVVFFVFVMSPGPCKDWADGPSPTPLRGEGRMAKVHRFGGVPLWLGVRCFSLFNIDVSPCRWRVRSQVSDAGGFPRFELCLDGWLGRCFPECIVRGRPLSPGSVRVVFFFFFFFFLSYRQYSVLFIRQPCFLSFGRFIACTLYSVTQCNSRY